MAEYGLSLSDAMHFPLEAYLALVPAMVIRHGGSASSAGPDHVDHASSAARARAKAWLNETFNVLPQGQPGPPNALHRWLSTP